MSEQATDAVAIHFGTHVRLFRASRCDCDPRGDNSRGIGLTRGLVGDVLPERLALADSDLALGAARGSAAATQGLPRVCQDHGRAGFHPHTALLSHSDSRGAGPLEESSVLHARHGSRRRDVCL